MNILFVSTHGAVRGIMAESVAKKVSRLALLSVNVYSAGVEPAKEVPKEVLELLKEKGYPVEGLKPKGLDSVPYEDADVLITLSAEARDRCPYLEVHTRREHWVLEEVPYHRKEELTKLLEQIEALVKGLFKIS